MTSRRGSILGRTSACGLLVGSLAALSVAYALSAGVPSQEGTAAGSAHAKNSATPDWILELQARSARLLPPQTVRSEEPSFWI
jgi:hypothetical protein